jgi:predicted membrane-bound mannosyltransferase
MHKFTPSLTRVMVSWVLVAVVILFPLIQVPAVIYIGRYVKLREGETPARPPVRDFWTGPNSEDPSGSRAEADPTRIDPPSDALVCPECGTENGSSFRYCGDCASSLSAAD